MKNKFAAAALAALVLSLSSALAGEPIEGVDVKLGRIPPRGSIMLSATTARDGMFTFDKLTPGRYQLQLTLATRATRTAIKTSPSSVKRSSVVTVDGLQVVTVEIALGAEPVSAEIVITAPKGTISGTVRRADAASGRR